MKMSMMSRNAARYKKTRLSIFSGKPRMFLPLYRCANQICLLPLTCLLCIGKHANVLSSFSLKESPQASGLKSEEKLSVFRVG